MTGTLIRDRPGRAEVPGQRIEVFGHTGAVEQLVAPGLRTWDFPRGVAGVDLLLGFGADHGVPRERLLAGSGLDPAGLADPGGQVAARQELAVVANLVKALGDPPGLGLAAGARYRIGTFGIFGYACITSPTLREAVRFALGHLELSFTFCLPRVRVDGTALTLELDLAGVPAAVHRFLVERDLAAIYTVLTDMLDTPIPVLDLALPFPDPGVDGYAATFGRTPRFDAPGALARFPADRLDAPLPQANAVTVALCEQQCRELVAQRRARTGVAEQVRAQLVSVGGAPRSIAQVAGALALSERTLRRRLAGEGTSYRALLDEVRDALALELLAAGGLSVEDVAIRLGYAEASSFIAAFKRWHGQTPAAHARRPRRPAD
jgi:AraC-like DNA-binding protein